MIEIGIRLKDLDFNIMAEKYDIDVNILKAFILTECSGYGFYENTNYPVIRLENHWFNKLTKGKYKESHPHLTTHFEVKNYNLKGVAEITRFDEAFELDEKAACLSTSWGLGQVMGFNYEVCGYDDIFDFVRDMFISELYQLTGMLEYMKFHKIMKFLKEKNMSAVFSAYNGKDYAEYGYDEKFQKNYKHVINNGTFR